MQINKNNYEEYAIDWLEGNLKGEELKSMEAFLSENPEIRAELTGLEEIVLTVPQTVFAKKEQLTKKERGAFPWLLLFGLMLIPMFFTMIVMKMPYTFFNSTEGQTESIKTEEIKEEKTLNRTAQIGENTEKQISSEDNKSKDLIKKDQSSGQNTSGITEPLIPAVNLNNMQTGQNTKVIIDQAQPDKKSESDSLKRVLDSLQQINGQPKINWGDQPMAAVDAKQIEIKGNNDAVVSKLLIEAMVLDFKPENRQGFAVRKSKGIKTPFGTIRFKEIREALLPESYIASVK